VKELLQLFTQTKLLIPLTDEESFVLGRDPQTISIKEILDSIRNGGRKTNLLSDELQDESEVNELLLKLDQSVSKALEGQTLQTLIATSGASSSRKASTSAETAA
jgi:DNA-binding IscR family transcriptional regulator